MRVLETIGTIGILLCGLLLPFYGGETEFGLPIALATLVIGCHLLREGWRLQMIPAYFSIVVMIVYECQQGLWGYQSPEGVSAVIALSALTALVTCIAMPVFRLPLPTGPYEVGTQTRCIVDESRREANSDDPDAKRQLIIQIWYPAEPVLGKARMASYRDQRITTLKSAHFALVATHSALDAQISKSSGPFPVLLYTPSWSGIRTECTIQIEEMASHGYVVVAIDHPYSSSAVVFPDGRIVHRNFSGEESYASDEAIAAFVKVADEQVRFRAEDTRFVLDTLEVLNGNDPDGLLTGALSLDQVGIFGFSLGGGTAAQACAIDRRFKAGLDMGGMIAGEAIEQGTSAPFFFMFEGMYESAPYVADANIFDLTPCKRREVEFTRNQFAQMKMSLSKSGGYWMTIDGIGHQDFSDAPFFSPLRRGSGDPRRIAGIISEFARIFFDEHLKNVGRFLLEDHISRFREVRLEVWAQVSRGDYRSRIWSGSALTCGAATQTKAH